MIQEVGKYLFSASYVPVTLLDDIISFNFLSIY